MNQLIRSSSGNSSRSIRAVMLVRLYSTRITTMSSKVVANQQLLLDTASNKKQLVIAAVQERHFSNYNRPPPPQQYYNPPRPFPVYSVPGELCTLSIKFMPPGFKLLTNSSLVLDTSRRGRLLLEFSPRAADGTVLWNQAVRFGLSAEEVGLFINQLPQYPIELSRTQGKFGNQDSEGGGGERSGSDSTNKVLKIQPGESGTVTFSFDFVKDGVGGQELGGLKGPLEIMVEAGEFEVIAAIFRDTLTAVIGWKQLVERAIEGSIAESARRPPGRDGGNVPF